LEYPGNGRNELDHRKELTSLGIIAGEGPSAGERWRWFLPRLLLASVSLVSF